MGALDDPAVPAEAFAGIDAASGDAWGDTTGATLLPPCAGIIGLVGVQFGWSLPGSPMLAAQWWDGIEGGCHHHTVVAVGAGQPEPEWRAAGIGDEMALRARLAPIRRVRTCRAPPFLAGTVALSSAARDQSICPAA